MYIYICVCVCVCQNDNLVTSKPPISSECNIKPPLRKSKDENLFLNPTVNQNLVEEATGRG